jgi:hypothetical protein
MIRCHLHHLETRCRQRGYTLDEVRPCIVSQDGDHITVDETHPAYPATPKPGLGDMVAAGLSAVGITKERAQAVATAVGVKDCGCKKRQERLNQLGRRLGIG